MPAFFFYFDPVFLLLMLPFLGLSIWAAARVKSTFAKYNQQPIRSRVSGAEAARVILRAAGIHDVELAQVPGMLSDHYDPVHKRVCLSNEVLHGRTPAAVAVAAHEVGHAIQHAQGYAPLRARSALVPVVQFSSSLALPMIIVGALLVPFRPLILVGVVLFSFAVLFHLVTLPVEFDASRRAIRILGQSGLVAPDEMEGVRKTLYAAGFTYVAAALVAVVQLLYWLWRLGLLGGHARG